MTPKNNSSQQSSYGKIKPSMTGPYTSIYLIRHCHPNYKIQEDVGDANMPLDNVGRKQRTRLTKTLLQKNITAIYASELLRSQQTAEKLAQELKLKINIDSRLNEIDWIDWYKVKYFNMTEVTRQKRLAGYKKMERQLNKFQTSARRALADICKQCDQKEIAIFSHGNLIRAILTSILNADVIGFLSMEIYQSSISKLEIDHKGYVKINYINNIAHLPQKPDEDMFRAALN